MKILKVWFAVLFVISMVIYSGCSRPAVKMNPEKAVKVEESSIQEKSEEKQRTDKSGQETSVPQDSSVDKQEKSEDKDYNPGEPPLKTSEKVTKPETDGSESEKIVFLTMDDGPSNLTPEFLDVLKENDVHATFCVLGTNAKAHPEIIKRAYEEGNSIVSHGYVHDYKIIYATPQSFIDSVDKSNQIIDSVIDRTDMEKKFFRFPGGSSSSTLVKGDRKGTIDLLKSKGYNALEWNLSTADSVPYKVEPELLASNATKASGKKEIVVLMHDTGSKHATLKALPMIIRYYKEKGYSFKTVRDMTLEDLERLKDKKIVNRVY